MAKRPKIKSVENAWEEIERSEKSLEVIKDSFPGRSITETVERDRRITRGSDLQNM